MKNVLCGVCLVRLPTVGQSTTRVESELRKWGGEYLRPTGVSRNCSNVYMSKKKSHKERSDADRRVRQCERLARLMQVLHLISGRGRWDAAALAEELECSTRTIHRLLQTLSIAGVPWFYDEKRKAYTIRPGYKFPLLDSSQDANEGQSQSPEVQDATEKLIRDGEAFAQSLEEFLSMLKQAKKRDQK